MFTKQTFVIKAFFNFHESKEAPVKNSKKASRGKITKVVEEEEPAAVLEGITLKYILAVFHKYLIGK